MTPTHIPRIITAGDSISWQQSSPDSDYLPSAGWTAICTLVNSSSRIVASGTINGEAWDFSISATTSAGFTAGVYHYAIQASKSGEVRTLETGTVEVLAAITSAVDRRSFARRALAAIEAVLENRASKSDASFTIAGRTVARIPITDLLTFRDRFKIEVAQEDAAERIARGEVVPGSSVKILFR